MLLRHELTNPEYCCEYVIVTPLKTYKTILK